MQKSDQSIIRKIYIIASLSGMILLALIYLVASGGSSRLQAALDSHETASLPTSEATAEPSATPISTSTPSADPQVSATPEPTPAPDLSSDDSLLKILNHSNYVSASYVPTDLIVPNVSQYDTQTLRAEAAEQLTEMFHDASAQGISLYLVSGYRNYQFQEYLWNKYVSEFGEEYTNTIDAYPGGSEHQLGLAVDLGSEDHNCELQGCFAYSSASQWLVDHAWEYGYIERYPEGKEEITGMRYMPWAYRYIGREEAEKVHASGLCLEEYYGLN